jgi:hypothetical protein
VRHREQWDTVVHGDCKTANIIFHRSAAGAVAATPIDFQWSGRAHASTDAAYLLSSSLEIELLRAEPLAALVALWDSAAGHRGGGSGDGECCWADAVDVALLQHALVVVPYMWGSTNIDAIRAQAPFIGRCAYNRSVEHVVAVAGWMVDALARFGRE